MRCIHCGNDAKYRERSSGHCPSCRRRFAFEPRRDRGLTDPAFKLAIEGVSDSGRLAWNDDQLYHELCRRVRRRRILHRLLRRPIVSLDRQSFDLLLSRWVDTHGPVAGRLARNVFGEVQQDALDARVDAYGFERLLVCDEDAIADVLLVNGFHSDARCPVLSRRGYPAHVYEALIPRLREQPPATVMVVHSADGDGCRLATAIADDPRWFAGIELPQVVDAGLRPGDAPRYRGLYQQATSGFDDTTPGLLPGEAKWLGTYRLDLAAARPRVLMGVLGGVLRAADEGRLGTDAGGFWVGEGWGEGDDEVG